MSGQKWNTTVETTLQIPYIAFEEQKHLNHFPVSMPTCMHQRSLHPYIQIIGNIQSNISIRIKIVETDRNVTRIYPLASTGQDTTKALRDLSFLIV
jgi:hypothetical protein